MSVAPRDDTLSMEERRKIDRVCNRFEEEWLAGRRPEIEFYLRQVSPAGQAELLNELLQLELDYRRSVNEAVEADPYRRRFPRHREVIAQAFQAALARPVPVRFLPGSKIGRYEVRRSLGAGAFAVVYLAWDAQLQREVAVKVPHRYLLTDPSARQRFLAEARTVASLRHPRIVALYDVAELDDRETIYLVLQYVGGESLRQRLGHGPLPPSQASRIAARVSEAMAVAHRAGVFHRDLKPSNILLDEQDEPHICDFGLALHVDEQRERQGEYAGTLTYMSPEQMRGETHRLDGRADIWSLGVILYEMLTGRVPFVGRSREELCDEILHRDPRPPRQLDARIARDQERVCLRCLAKQPSDRFATASDVAEALLASVGRRRRLWFVLVLLLTVLASWGSIGAGILWQRWQPAAATLGPLEGTVDLVVWDRQRPERMGLPAEQAQALPLRSGDRVRVVVQLNQPAYAYVVWLDVHGAALPVYPWRAGQWHRLIDEQPVSYCSLPNERSNGWEMKVPRDGTESILLLVRRTPLPQDVDLNQLLRDLPQVQRAGTGAARFCNGQLLPASSLVTTMATERPPDLDQLVRIPDPLLMMQHRAAEILRPHFELVQALSFPVTKRESGIR